MATCLENGILTFPDPEECPINVFYTKIQYASLRQVKTFLFGGHTMSWLGSLRDV